MTLLRATISLVLILTSAAFSAANPEQAAKKLEQFLGEFPDLGPGYAVIAVTKDKVLLDYANGLRNAETGAKLTHHTPVYIASQTKAYMGLLATKLDEKGILKLDSKITDHWPDVKFPAGVEPTEYTLADLLNHKVPIEVGVITFLEAYVTELDYRDYPALIAEHAEKRDSGFEYDNLGYNIYSAILHKATGKSWQTWLQEEIFSPLQLTKTSAKTSDFPLQEISWNHLWQGKEKGWHLVRPKTDEIMQSAGGMVTSPADMGRWLQFHLSEGSQVKGFSNAVMKRAHTSGVKIDPKKRNAYELPCDGYALGWNICNFEGNRLYIHGGGYTGARTMMAFSPDLGVGIGVFSNSDNMTGWLTSRTTVQFLQYLVDHKDAEKMSEIRQRVYPERIQKLLEYRLSRLEKVKNDSKWNDWQWQPTKQEFNAYLGKYKSDELPIIIEIKRHKDKLIAQAHSYKATLIPASKHLFGAQSNPLDTFDAVEFSPDSKNNIQSFTWDGRTYTRIN